MYANQRYFSGHLRERIGGCTSRTRSERLVISLVGTFESRCMARPILLVEGKVVSQGEALNRGVLVQSVISEWVKRELKGNIVYGKATCPYCVKAKQLLDDAGIKYEYHDVVKDSAALYRMIPEVKAIIGEKTPVTVPQIWLEGKYVGGADNLEKWLAAKGLDKVPNNVVEIPSQSA